MDPNTKSTRSNLGSDSSAMKIWRECFPLVFPKSKDQQHVLRVDTIMDYRSGCPREKKAKRSKKLKLRSSDPKPPFPFDDTTSLSSSGSDSDDVKLANAQSIRRSRRDFKSNRPLRKANRKTQKNRKLHELSRSNLSRPIASRENYVPAIANRSKISAEVEEVRRKSSCREFTTFTLFVNKRERQSSPPNKLFSTEIEKNTGVDQRKFATVNHRLKSKTNELQLLPPLSTNFVQKDKTHFLENRTDQRFESVFPIVFGGNASSLSESQADKIANLTTFAYADSLAAVSNDENNSEASSVQRQMKVETNHENTQQNLMKSDSDVGATMSSYRNVGVNIVDVVTAEEIQAHETKLEQNSKHSKEASKKISLEESSTMKPLHNRVAAIKSSSRESIDICMPKSSKRLSEEDSNSANESKTCVIQFARAQGSFEEALDNSSCISQEEVDGITVEEISVTSYYSSDENDSEERIILRDIICPQTDQQSSSQNNILSKSQQISGSDVLRKASSSTDLIYKPMPSPSPSNTSTHDEPAEELIPPQASSSGADPRETFLRKFGAIYRELKTNLTKSLSAAQLGWLSSISSQFTIPFKTNSKKLDQLDAGMIFEPPSDFVEKKDSEIQDQVEMLKKSETINYAFQIQPNSRIEQHVSLPNLQKRKSSWIFFPRRISSVVTPADCVNNNDLLNKAEPDDGGSNAKSENVDLNQNVELEDQVQELQESGSLLTIFDGNLSASASGQSVTPKMSTTSGNFKTTASKWPWTKDVFPEISKIKQESQDLQEEIITQPSLRPSRWNLLYRNAKWLQSFRANWAKLKNWFARNGSQVGQSSDYYSSDEEPERRQRFVQQRTEFMDRIVVPGSRKRKAIPREMYVLDDGAKGDGSKPPPRVFKFDRKPYYMVVSKQEQLRRKSEILNKSESELFRKVRIRKNVT